MRAFADIERRIEHLCSPASLMRDDVPTLAEIGDVLARGYVAALQADARCRRLAERIEALAHQTDAPERAGEVRRLSQERRTIRAATRDLRGRLEMVRVLFAQVSARLDP